MLPMCNISLCPENNTYHLNKGKESRAQTNYALPSRTHANQTVHECHVHAIHGGRLICVNARTHLIGSLQLICKAIRLSSFSRHPSRFIPNINISTILDPTLCSSSRALLPVKSCHLIPPNTHILHTFDDCHQTWRRVCLLAR